MFPAVARAGNGLHERTPVLFPTVPCMTIVDRSVDPVLHIDYEIPYEDPSDEMKLSDDEVDDSRTHQFFMFCRGHSRQVFPPTWVTHADAADADANGLLDSLPGADEVLETSTDWSGCWVRVNEDVDRRAITFANATAGIDWDTSAVPAGAYVLHGYTYEPAFNVYWPRAGVIKVVDDASDATTAPALAIANETNTFGQMDEALEAGIYIYRDELYDFTGCVDAMPGSTLSVYTAATTDGGLGPWELYLGDIPLADVSDGETWSIEFDPQLVPQFEGTAFALRIDVTDPMGRTYAAHAFWLVTVLAENAPVDCEETSGGFLVDPECETSTGGSDTGGGSDAGTTSPGSDSDASAGATTDSTGSSASTSAGASGPIDGGDGCGCRAGSRRGALAPLFLLLFGVRRRRRS